MASDGKIVAASDLVNENLAAAQRKPRKPKPAGAPDTVRSQAATTGTSTDKVPHSVNRSTTSDAAAFGPQPNGQPWKGDLGLSARPLPAAVIAANLASGESTVTSRTPVTVDNQLAGGVAAAAAEPAVATKRTVGSSAKAATKSKRKAHAKRKRTGKVKHQSLNALLSLAHSKTAVATAKVQRNVVVLAAPAAAAAAASSPVSSFNNQSARPLTSPRATATTGSISGTITDKATAAKLSGICVVAQSDMDNAEVDACTDGSGSYTLSGLAAGTWYVTVQDHVSDYIEAYLGDVAVAAGATTGGQNAALTKGGAFAGTVTSATGGAPLSGICVSAIQNGAYYGSAGDCTDASGHFQTTGVPAGKYVLEAVDTNSLYELQYLGGTDVQNNSTVVTATVGSTHAATNFALQKGGSITGKVTDGSGNPLPGICGNVADPQGNYEGTISCTDASGSYTAGGLRSGSYTIFFNDQTSHYASAYLGGATSIAKATYVSVSEGAATTGATTKLSPSASIAGTVTDSSGNAISNVCVDVNAANVYEDACTDSTGHYAVYGLSTNSFTVYVDASGTQFLGGYYPGAVTSDKATPVQVSSGQQTSDINFSLAKGGQISGTLTDAVSRQSVAYGCVNIYSGGSEISSACTDDSGSGNYLTDGLPAGTYTVQASADGYENGQLGGSSPTSVTVTAGAVIANENVTLTPEGSIAGTVTSSSGTPIAGVCVQAYLTSQSYSESQACTSANGTYVITGLSAGNYNLDYSASDTAYVSQWSGGATTQSAASAVSVTKDQATTGANASLALGGSVSGALSDANDGSAVLGCVSLSDSTGGQVASSCGDDYGDGVTGTSTYTLQGLAAGTYTLQATSFDYLPTTATVTVTLGKSQSSNLILNAAGGISGTVSDSAGVPIESICVEASDAGGDDLADACSDRSGNYILHNLPTGQVTLHYTASGTPYLGTYYGGTTASTATPVSVTAGARTANVNVSLVKGGQISGSLTDSQTGNPVNACVDVFDSTGTQVDQACGNNSAAIYLTDGLAAGSYTVSAQTYGYVTTYFGGSTDQATATAISVPAGTVVSGKNIALVPLGSITGTLTAADTGKPLSNVCVSAYDAAGDGGNGGGGCTDSSGKYSLTGLTAGSYTVSFPATGAYIGNFYKQSATSDGATQVTVSNGHTTSGIDSSLTKGGQISGTLTDAKTGSAVTGYVNVYDSSGNYAGYDYADASGNYLTNGLPAGSYVVYGSAVGYVGEYFGQTTDYDSATAVPVKLGAVNSGKNIQLTQAGIITGTVTASSGSLSNSSVDVTALTSAGDYVQDTYIDSQDGSYTLDVPSGSYVIEFRDGNGHYATQYYNGADTIDKASSVTATSGKTVSGINANLKVSPAITGTVTAADTGKAIDTSTGAEVCVEAFSTANNSYAGETCNLDSNGGYTLTGLNAGTYKVYFYVYSYNSGGSASAYLPQYYNNKPTLAAADTVTLSSSGATTGINAVLQRSGSISGVVTDAASGSSLQGICVNVFLPNNTSSSVGYSCSDANGKYSVSGLSTASYLVEFVDNNGRHLTQWATGETSSSTADLIGVKQNSDTPNVNASLALGAAVSGTVTAASTGKPIANACVALQSTNGNYSSGNYSRCTDASGNYTSPGVAAGTYDAYFTGGYQYNSTTSYAPQYYNNATTQSAATALTLTTAQLMTGVNASLALAATITGTITDSAGNAVSNQCADAYQTTTSASGTTSQSYVNGGCSTTNGSYTISGLSAGTYVVDFYGGSGYTGQYFNHAADFAHATSITLAAGQTSTNVNASLTQGSPVSGTVTGNDTGKGISGVSVSLSPSNSSTGSYASASTGTDGTWTANVPPGTYTVSFSDYYGPYLAATYSTSGGSATTITVGSTAVTGINQVLTRGATVSGTITDATTGNPISNVCVSLFASSSSYSYYGYSGSLCSDSTGAYTSSGVPTGSYIAEFTNNGGRYATQYYQGSTTAAGATTLTLTAGANTAKINAAMVLGGVLTGTVTSGGKPVSNVCVSLFVASSGAAAGQGTCTDSTGKWSATVVAGSYKLHYVPASGSNLNDQWYSGKTSESAADAVTATAGATTSGLDASLTAVSRSISGTVTSGGNPVSGVCAYLYDSTGTTYQSYGGCTDSSGNYTIAGMPAGTYTVAVYDPKGAYDTTWYPNAPSKSGATTIAVSNGPVTGINVTAHKRTTISGTATAAGATTGLAGICVYLYADGGSYTGTSTCTDGNGNYSLSGMAAGSYDVAFTDPHAVYATQWYSGASTQASATKVTVVDSGAATGVNASMVAQSAVSGTVTDSVSKTGVAGVCVYVYDTGTNASAGASCTGSDGTYTVSPLPAGTYKIAFYDPSGTRTTQWWNGAATESAGTAVKITAGQRVTGINAVMVAQTSVTGQVTDSTSGVGVSTACVYLYSSSGTYGGYASCTDSTGKYTIAGMPAGTYTVAATDSTAARSTTWYGNVYRQASAQTITVTAGQHLTAVNIAMARVTSITGTVKTAAGAARTDVCVYADDSTGTYTNVGGCTSSTGTYTLTGLAPGTYKLGYYPPKQSSPTIYWYSGASTESSATGVTTTAGQTTSNINETVG